jgi:DnaK suppressor protein
MTTPHRKTFDEVLLARALELARSLAERNQIAVEQSADAIDATLLAAERETSARNLTQEYQLLREVEAARDRMREGTYGICQRCEEEIAPKRLQAIPWAALCVSCQAKTENAEQQETAARPRLARAA